MRNTLCAMALAVVACALGNLAHAQPSVLQRGYDTNVSGANLNETTLTTSNVNPTSFGLVSTLPVDDKIYAQPLYVPQVAIPNQGTHNVLYVATMSDTLYAFDADVGTKLWSVNFANSVGAVPVQVSKIVFGGNGNLTGNLGILSTPVIDPSTNIMYLVACTLENGTMVYRLHAVNIANGTEPYPNVMISGSYNGVNFNPPHQTQRVSLTLSGNQVVFAFGAVEAESDDESGYSGWVMAYNKQTLAQSGIFATITAGGSLGGGIWQSGRPPVVDGAGFVYLFTGNGFSSYDGVNNFNETVLKLNVSNGITLVDWFTPKNWAAMDGNDSDLSSSGPLLIPNTSPGLLAGGGKTGVLYVLNTSNMGHFSANDSGVVQEETVGASSLRGGPVYWQRSASNGGPLLYNWATNDVLKSFAFNGSSFGATPTSQGSLQFAYPGGILTLSANGQQQGTGVLWATIASSGNVYDDPTDPGVLYAFDANNVATQLYSSTTNSSRDNFGSFAKLCPPLVVNGKVYVATFSNEVAVYGLLSPSAPVAATPSFNPLPGNYSGTQQVTLTDGTNGAVIYYTTDGSTPTTASAQYVTGTPIPVSNSETIKAIAVATGYTNSNVATGIYTIAAVPVAATPSFNPLPGNYSGTQQVALTDGTNGAVIYYTTDGSTPTSVSAQYVTGTPIPVSNSETIKAIAVATGYTNSNVATGIYTISSSSSGTTPVSVSLSTADSLYGIGTVGTAVSNGGLDGGGHAYASALLGTSLTWSGSSFTLGAANAADAVSSATITLPSGSYTTLNLLATGVNGNQTGQTFVVTYSDNTTTKITQSLSDWYTPQNYAGESIALSMAYRLNPNGAAANGTFNLYGYSFALNSAKTVKSITLPSNNNVVVLAMDLIPATGSPPPPAVAATPSFNPLPGNYSGTQQVTLTDGTNGAVIYYTTDGSTPTTTSTQYVTGTPIPVSNSETIKAIAVATGYTNSNVATGIYTISSSSSGTTPVSVSLSTADSLYGIGTVGTAVSNGGLDGGGHAYASALLGTSLTWSGSSFTLGAANAADAVSSATITLPSGSYTTLNLLATGVNGNQTGQTFVVTYSDNTTTKITQSLSDWYTPQNYAGESIALSMAYRLNPNGAAANGTFNLYGYSFALNSAKTVKSITLPSNNNVVVLAMDLIPATGSPPPPAVAATPSFNPLPGNYSGTQQVTLTDGTNGAVIYYTTDGSTPTSVSTQYVTGTPIPVSNSETIKAIAVATGYTNSNVATGIYTISSSSSGTTPVSVSLSTADSLYGIGTVGTAVSNGGLDGGGHAYASALLGTSLTWSGSSFTLGAANAADAVSSATITLPSGSYTTLNLLATGVNGNQTGQTFVVTYSDNTTTKITQSLSDWYTPQNYAGESIALSMAYRLNPNGTADNRTFNLYGYSFTLNKAKTVKSITLPSNTNVVVLGIDLAP